MKNHITVNGKLLQTNKKFTQLKSSQKEKINLWLYEEYSRFWKENSREPVAKIGLRGMVLPSADTWYRFKYKMGDLRLKQSKVTFNEVKVGMQPEARILCGNSGRKPLRISSLVLPQYAQIRTEPKEIVPGDEADLVITLLVDKIPPMMKPNFTFPIILEGVDAKPSDRTITVQVNRD